MNSLSNFERVLFGINCVPLTLLGIAVLTSYYAFDRIPILHIVSLTVPVLVLVNLAFLVFWMIRKKMIFIFPLVVLIVSYGIFGLFFKFGISKPSTEMADLKLMSFNTRAFNKYNWIDNPHLGEEIVVFVAEQDPDIICFQEFQSGKYAAFAQYPYRYMNYIFPNKKRHVVQAIFSKYPIVNEGSLDFPESANNAIYIDVTYKKDTLRIYNLHLESLKVDVDKAKLTNEYSGKFMERVRKSFKKQREQALLFQKHSNSSTHKKLIMGDLNNTQFSNVYRTIKGDYLDTFLEKGTGYGRTYNFKYFPVRIDFIMVDPSFEVKTHRTFDVNLSDHLPIMASLSL